MPHETKSLCRLITVRLIIHTVGVSRVTFLKYFYRSFNISCASVKTIFFIANT